MIGRTLAIAFAIAGAAPSAKADPPKINEIRPFGVRRGAPAELTIAGSGLSGSPSLVAPFAFRGDVLPASDGGNFRLRIDVPADVPLGVYPVRVRTDDGLSNPFLLAVGQVPQVAEAEENSTFEQAQAVPSPVIVEGQCSGTDVDYFKFPGAKGQRVIVDAQCARIGSGMDPQIRLTTIGRKFVEAADDTPGLLTDARLSATLPDDGEYVVEISDSKYQGAGRPIYRLLIGPVPVAAEVYPVGGRRGETVGLELRGGTLDGVKIAAATIAAPPLADQFLPRLAASGLEIEIPAALDVSDLPEMREATGPSAPPIRGAAPVVFNGRIDPPGDEDRFALAVTPGQSLRIRVDASEQGSALDGTLQVLAPDGKVLATAEDTVTPAVTRGNRKIPGMVSPDPSLDFAVPAGVTEITLAIRDLIGRGGIGLPYRISIEPITPSFQVLLNESQVNVPRGGTSAVGVTIQRQGYNGPVALSIPDAPPGLSMRPFTIPAGQPGGTFTISATKEAAFGPIDLKVTGTGQGPNGTSLTELGSKQVVYASQGTLPVKTVTQNGLPASSAMPLLAAIDSPPAPVEIVHGYGGPVPVKVLREEKGEGALTFAPVSLPPAVTVAGAIAEKDSEGAATINAPIESPIGPATVVIAAKGKLGGKDVTLVAPSVMIDVVRPVAVEWGSLAIEIKAGEAVELKGKLVRKPPFKEPVKIALNGLPAGLKADPIDVAAEAIEFALKVQADPGANAASGSAQAALAFKVGGKDYPYPPTALAVKVVK